MADPNRADRIIDAFDTYAAPLRPAGLALFDANCPAFFAANERSAYAAFLDRVGPGYFVRLEGGRAIAAFGLVDEGAPRRRRLNWIMVHPQRHRDGLGGNIMACVLERGRAAGATAIDIAASHLSAPFFSRFGAHIIARAPHGWGPDMHRTDMELPLAGTGS